MKLYELEWGLYPRRVTIYLAEKGISDIERVAFDAMTAWPAPEMSQLSPMGTVPVLTTASGALIRSSIAILEYLEELFPSPNMLGDSPEARARTRELVDLIDEACIQFGIWCHKGSRLFEGREQQSRDAAAFAAEAYYDRLRMLDTLAQENGGSFLNGSQVTIADCIATATLQFAENVYGVPVPQNCDALMRWYTKFSARPSTALPFYPEPVLALSQGLPSQSSLTTR